MLGFRRTRMLILGVAGLLVWQGAGHAPAALSAAIENIDATITGILPGHNEAEPPLGAWRTCNPIHVYVNPGNAGQGGIDTATTAIATAAQASGLPLVYAGTTHNTPTSAWVQHTAPKRSVTIAWASPQETDLLTGSRAGATSVRVRSDGSITAAGIALNSDMLADYPAGFGSGRTMGNLLLHELGHAAGLGHSHSGTLMNSKVAAAAPDGYTSEDLDALSRQAPGC